MRIFVYKKASKIKVGNPKSHVSKHNKAKDPIVMMPTFGGTC